MAPTVLLVAALFRISNAAFEEDASLLQMPVAGSTVATDAADSDCACPGYFENVCNDNVEQGCTWTADGESNAAWCQCDEEVWQRWKNSGALRFPAPPSTPPAPATPQPISDLSLSGFTFGSWSTNQVFNTDESLFHASRGDCGEPNGLFDLVKPCDARHCNIWTMCTTGSGSGGWRGMSDRADRRVASCPNWECRNLFVWFAYEFAEPTSIAEYSWQTSENGCPYAWTLQSSMDGSTWTDVSSETAQTCGTHRWNGGEVIGADEWNTYSTGTTTRATHWRWRFEAVTGGGNHAFLEFSTIRFES